MEKTQEKGTGETIFVKSSTSVKGLATCIMAEANNPEVDVVKIRGIGAGANNQMTKAIIVAKGKLSAIGVGVNLDVYFKNVESSHSNDTISAIEYSLLLIK
tara:strand:+ start:71876 stop:72178 length:303 start_codon:yes stop_codon:yes gene_type:complete